MRQEPDRRRNQGSDRLTPKTARVLGGGVEIDVPVARLVSATSWWCGPVRRVPSMG